MEEELVYCLKGHKMRSALPAYGAKCDACATSSSESTGEAMYYSCSECDITIHRRCAQLPKQIDHPMHPKHPLLLLTEPPYQREPMSLFEPATCQCQVCKKVWSNFVYHCSSCEFDIDVVCAFLEQDIMIPTHHHPVRLITRSSSFICNACDRKSEDGESYMCTKPSCGFWIHKTCGSSPGMFIHPDHDHPLLLAISMPARYRKYKFTCEICQNPFSSSSWVYYCQRCKYLIHINCIQRDAPPDAWDNVNSFPLSFVMIRDMKTVTEHTFPASRIADYSVEKAHHEYLKQEDKRLAEVKVDSHKHSLVLISDDDDEVICDGCIERIDGASSSPYYKCGQNCNFFLHTTCAILPKHRLVGNQMRQLHGSGQELKLYFPKNPWEALKCRACNSFCNGYGYKCTRSGCDVYLDIKCGYLIGYIKHIGHKHRLNSVLSWHTFTSFDCSVCGFHYQSRPFLKCYPCSNTFKIGYECATLPATVTHRWDKHPLILTFPPFFRDSPNADEEFYCEVCVDEIHPKHWIYRCAECDQSFHPRCIPTLGECRNIKFGKTFRIQSHPHPLTLVPQARLTSKCYYCRKSLNWSRAFECAPCGFYLCPDCIPKEELVEE